MDYAPRCGWEDRLLCFSVGFISDAAMGGGIPFMLKVVPSTQRRPFFPNNSRCRHGSRNFSIEGASKRVWASGGGNKRLNLPKAVHPAL